MIGWWTYSVDMPFVIGPVRYEYILPNDFAGRITVVYHPDGPDRIPYSGNTVTLVVPPSGLIVTPDCLRLHHLSNYDEWRYQDGRIISHWFKLAPGFAYVGSKGAEGRGVRPDDTLLKWALWDPVSKYCHISTMNYEVLRSSKLDATSPPIER